MNRERNAGQMSINHRNIRDVYWSFGVSTAHFLGCILVIGANFYGIGVGLPEGTMVPLQMAAMAEIVAFPAAALNVANRFDRLIQNK